MHTLFPGFRRVPLLLDLEKVFSGNIINNLTQLILRSLMEHGGLTTQHVVSKFTCFGCDKVVVFTIILIGVITLFKCREAPFIIGMHCMAHCTNLVV
jgi:hypothetical protein